MCALCGYTVVVESGFARQLLDVLAWRRLMKVPTEARCHLVCRVVRAEPVNLAEFPMNPIDCYTSHNNHAHFLLPEVEHTIIAFQNVFVEKAFQKELLIGEYASNLLFAVSMWFTGQTDSLFVL